MRGLKLHMGKMHVASTFIPDLDAYVSIVWTRCAP